MKNIIEELWNGERGPQGTPVDNNLHYKKLQQLQSRNKAELIECLSEKQKAKPEKYCDITLEMSPYPNAKPLHRDSESPCGWRAPRLRIRQMNNATQPLDSEKNQGAVAVSPHARISGVPRLSDLRAGKGSSEPFKADTGDSGVRARGMRHEV